MQPEKPIKNPPAERQRDLLYKVRLSIEHFHPTEFIRFVTVLDRPQTMI